MPSNRRMVPTTRPTRHRALRAVAGNDVHTSVRRGTDGRLHRDRSRRPGTLDRERRHPRSTSSSWWRMEVRRLDRTTRTSVRPGSDLSLRRPQTDRLVRPCRTLRPARRCLAVPSLMQRRRGVRSRSRWPASDRGRRCPHSAGGSLRARPRVPFRPRRPRANVRHTDTNDHLPGVRGTPTPAEAWRGRCQPIG